MRSRIAIAGLITTSFAAVTAAVLACEMTVRDSAFKTPRDVHHLLVIGSEQDPETTALVGRLTNWLEGPANRINLELVFLDVDRSDIRWSDYGIPSAPPQVPVTALMGKNYGTNESFLIHHWDPGPSDSALAELLSSPTRETISRELAQRVAVILHAPGAAPDGQAGSTVADFAKAWSEKNKLGISVVQLDRTDPREATLCSFAGLDPQGPDWVAVVFGRGRLLVPALRGGEISAARLGQLVEQLGQDCSCSKPLPSISVELPLAWTAELDGQIAWMIDPDQPDASELTPSEATLIGQTNTNAPPTPHGSRTTFLKSTIVAVSAVTAFVVLLSVAMLRRKQIS